MNEFIVTHRFPWLMWCRSIGARRPGVTVHRMSGVSSNTTDWPVELQGGSLGLQGHRELGKVQEELHGYKRGQNVAPSSSFSDINKHSLFLTTENLAIQHLHNGSLRPLDLP